MVGESKTEKKALADKVTQLLESRISGLLEQFKADIESIGFEFTYSEKQGVTA